MIVCFFFPRIRGFLPVGKTVSFARLLFPFRTTLFREMSDLFRRAFSFIFTYCSALCMAATGNQLVVTVASPSTTMPLGTTFYCGPYQFPVFKIYVTFRFLPHVSGFLFDLPRNLIYDHASAGSAEAARRRIQGLRLPVGVTSARRQGTRRQPRAR